MYAGQAGKRCAQMVWLSRGRVLEQAMQRGTICRSGQADVIGTWRADEQTLSVETADPALRAAAEEILGRPQAIPLHGPEHFQFAAEAVPSMAAPTSIRYLALVALELEARGFVMQPDDSEAFDESDTT